MDYNTLKMELEVLEDLFDEDQTTALFKMVELYVKLEGTNYHDIADAIEIWIFENYTAEVEEYLERKTGNMAEKLNEIVKNQRS